ncbi:MAG TPA: glycosyltransferase [Terriglobales bacterium]|nr:glycosyltransferase [Terriglobales bacterium]
MRALQIRIFAHSWISDWNHGNAHFLRGLAYELVRMGHQVRCYEMTNSWSFRNLLEEGPDYAAEAFLSFRRAFPALDVRFFNAGESFLSFAEEELRGADLVLVHEWNEPETVKTILALRRRFGFRVLLHDTHHRAYTNPQEILRFSLAEFDGVLAFGEAIRRIYSEAFQVKKVWTFHEAADTAHFRPMQAQKDTDVVWVGNWGDEERTRELQEFLIGPAAALRERRIVVHGVRYPDHARQRLSEAGIEYRGYLPNLKGPYAYARSLLSLHVPRRFYANGLSGVPTIRVFEALACGIPLVCSPWSDTEHLFRPGEDYVCAEDTRTMEAEIRYLLTDDRARAQIAANGLETIQKCHTCAHRAEQLIEIYKDIER